jgi:subtilisin family serine protease
MDKSSLTGRDRGASIRVEFEAVFPFKGLKGLFGPCRTQELSGSGAAAVASARRKMRQATIFLKDSAPWLRIKIESMKSTDMIQSRSGKRPGYKRPGYIVVFEQACSKNESILADLLNVKEASVPGLRESCLQFECKAPGLAGPRLYRRLALATADLNPEELHRLRKSLGILSVFPNLDRTLPQTRYSPIAPGPRASAANGGAAVVAAAPPGLPYHLVKVGATQPNPSGENVKVAVLDTGIDLNHLDFQGRFTEMLPDASRDENNVPNPNAVAGNAVNYVVGETLQDLNGHGTHCAGLIAGPPTPTVGPRYAVSPGVDLFVAKVLDQTGHGSDDNILEAIDWAADQGVRIISMSLGSSRAEMEPAAQPYERMANALLNQNPGVLIIAAAGNDSRRQPPPNPSLVMPVWNPAACASILAIASVDENDQIAPNSSGQADNIGEVNLSAPGVNIYSAGLGNKYSLASGTSQATPIAAGVAALMLERDPTLTARQLQARLLASAVPIAPPKQATDYGVGFARL